jgi:chemotaxis protein methyltransferase WspC
VELAHKRVAELAGARPLRILSLPCSTGEEPYSIAMALLDGGVAAHAFAVDGIDISPNSVARAEQALYGRNSFRGSELAFRERHFAKPATYTARRAGAPAGRLKVGNVLDPALKARDGQYDFVFCRNLLIYFDVPTQQRVFEVLKQLTHAEGVLFIGPAEGSLLARLGMRPLGIAQSFAYVRQADPAPAPADKPLPTIRPPLPPLPKLVTQPLRPARPSIAAPVTAEPRESEAQLLAAIARHAPATASRPGPTASATCASSNQGAGVLLAGAAQRYRRRCRRPSPITARRCTCNPSTRKRWCTWLPCWPRKVTRRAPGACRSARRGPWG